MPTMQVHGPEEQFLKLCADVFQVAAQVGFPVFAWYLSLPPRTRSGAILEGLKSLPGPKPLKPQSVEQVLRQFVTLSAAGKLTQDHLAWFATQDARKFYEHYDSLP